MDLLIRKLERLAAGGDREAEAKLYREKNRLGMIPPTLSARDMRQDLPSARNECGGFGTMEVCGCMYDPCELCDSGATEPCIGCWACLMPSVQFRYQFHTVEWVGTCLYNYSRDYDICPCTYCVRARRFRGAISTIRILRMIERSV